jgi:hypothetical protein
MKWIAFALIAIGALLFVDHRNGFVLLALGLMVLGYWYFVEREPPDPLMDDTDDQPQGHDSEPMVESSTSFDMSDFKPFLQQLRTQLSGGFGERIIDHISDFAARMKHDEEKSLEYLVTFRGRQCPLKLGVFRDDAGEITAYFHSPQPLADVIDSEIKSFFSARGKLPTLAEGLATLEQHGIRKRDDVSIEDILYSTNGTLNDPIDYPQLLCLIGSDVERDDLRPKSNDLWHFDTECIVDDGDYVRIAERLACLSKGALGISDVRDHVSVEESVAWLELNFRGKRIHWDFEVQDDWVDATVFTNFVQLFRDTPSDARFTYGDLGGQDCLIGFSTNEHRQALSALTGVKFEWLK